MQNFVFRESNFDLNNSQQYSLSIQADLDGFSFVIQQNQTGQIVLIHTESFMLSHYGILARKIQELTEKYDMLKGDFDNIQVYLPGSQTGVFPDDFHLEKEIRNSLLEKKSLKNRTKTVSSVTILPGYQLCWLIESTLKETIIECYPKARITHIAVPLIHYFANLHNNADKNWYCYLSDKEIFFLGFDKGQLCFFNKFSCIEEQDVLYYLMAISRVPKMENATVTITGHQERKDLMIKYCFDNEITAVPHNPVLRLPVLPKSSPQIPSNLIPLLI